MIAAEIDDAVSYWDTLKSRRTSSNGVFGYKMFIQFYWTLSQNHPRILKEISPDKVVYLRRRNIKSHVVSYARAMQTNSWFADSRLKREEVPSRDWIVLALDLLLAQKLGWKYVFELTDTTPYCFDYEDFQDDEGSVISAIMDYIGVEGLRQNLKAPAVRKQESKLAQMWGEIADTEINERRGSLEEVCNL